VTGLVQNIYDNAEFFAGYSRMRRSVDGLAGAAEWPAMQALLPDLQGRRVLDLGCGLRMVLPVGARARRGRSYTESLYMG
jgi:hypothetical protein